MINAPDLAVVTKIDVLDTFAEIPFCTEYKYKGSVLTEFLQSRTCLPEMNPFTVSFGMADLYCRPARMEAVTRQGAGLPEVPVRLFGVARLEWYRRGLDGTRRFGCGTFREDKTPSEDAFIHIPQRTADIS
jgi:hypothetical protein